MLGAPLPESPMESLALRRSSIARWLASVLALATLSCGSPSAPATGNHHNNTTAVYLSAAEDSVSQGDTVGLGVSFTSGDTPGDPLYLEISFDGSRPAVDSLTIPPAPVNDPSQTPVAINGYLVIPAGLPDGQLTVTVVLPNQGDSASATITIKDRRAPYFGGAFIVPGLTPNAFVNDMQSYANVIDLVAGATDSVDVSAADNHSVAWVGWAFGSPSNARDSVAIAGPAIQASIPFTVPASLAGTTPTFSLFVRDSDGNMAVDSFGQVNVAPYVHHPIRTVAVDTEMNDIAYDAKRNVLYLSEAGHANVQVLSLASMTFQTPLALPAQPAGLDLTPGGDSLVVALANTGDLAFIALTGTPTTSVVQLTSLDSVAGDSTTITAMAQSVRVAADGRVIVAALRTVSNVQSGAVVELDLTTGQNRIVYPGSEVALARSGDATRVLISGVVSYTQEATLYDGVGHQYLPLSGQAGVFQTSGIFMSATRTGTSYLVGNALFDGSLNTIGVVQADNEPSSQGYGSAISPSGTYVWLGGAGGGCTYGGGPGPCALNTPGFYYRFQVPTMVRGQEGQLIEVADAPQAVTQIVALPGDQTLIGVGANMIMAFDLTSSTPGPVSARVASRTLRPHITSVHAGARDAIRVRLRGKTRTLRVTPAGR
jgi:hypothetical protein